MTLDDRDRLPLSLRESGEDVEDVPPSEQELLTEIRDLLRARA